MSAYNDPCGLLNQQAVCNTANGQPSSPVIQVALTGSALDVAPENNIAGLAVGLHLFFRQSTAKLYIFGGTVGTKVGWTILN